MTEYIKSFDCSGYEFALTQAGAKVLAYKEFGTYQGDWLAKVEYGGSIFWIKDYFGSCSGCDAFENDIRCEYDKDEYLGYSKKKLAEFGKKYLLDPKSYEDVFVYSTMESAYDIDSDEMVKFIEANK